MKNVNIEGLLMYCLLSYLSNITYRFSVQAIVAVVGCSLRCALYVVLQKSGRCWN